MYKLYEGLENITSSEDVEKAKEIVRKRVIDKIVADTLAGEIKWKNTDPERGAFQTRTKAINAIGKEISLDLSFQIIKICDDYEDSVTGYLYGVGEKCKNTMDKTLAKLLPFFGVN